MQLRSEISNQGHANTTERTGVAGFIAVGRTGNDTVAARDANRAIERHGQGYWVELQALLAKRRKLIENLRSRKLGRQLTAF
jgi:hypothetical protein